MAEIEICTLKGLEDSQKAYDVQRRVWGEDEAELIPVHLFHALSHHTAGSLIGAFDGDELVGFALAVLSTIDDPNRIDQVAAARLKLYSAATGILPAYRDRAVGYRLKLAQRDFAETIGVRLISWTFDPLQGRNAAFNIAKLGAVSNRYHVNFYGTMTGINAGVASDRLEADWWVTSNRVKSRIEKGQRPLSLNALLGGGAVIANETRLRDDGWREPVEQLPTATQSLLLVEVPGDFDALKAADVELAITWRRHVRMVFRMLFGEGYLVTDFLSDSAEGGTRRNYYLLAQSDS